MHKYRKALPIIGKHLVRVDAGGGDVLMMDNREKNHRQILENAAGEIIM